MSDANINSMNIKQLRNEVQLLRDELAMMQRKYEDILYNLDYGNFSSKYIKETEDKIAFEVENSDKIATLEITAEGIKADVQATNDKFDNYSTIEQTANAITSTVSKSYLTDKLDGEYATKQSVTEVKQTANSISSRVDDVEDGVFTGGTLFTQTSGKFYFDGKKAVFTGVVNLTDNDKNEVFAITHDESQPSGAFVHLHSTTSTKYPIILGDSNSGEVYIGSKTNQNEVATKGWVLENGGGGGTTVAVFA